jgi:hypothetical protein
MDPRRSTLSCNGVLPVKKDFLKKNPQNVSVPPFASLFAASSDKYKISMATSTLQGLKEWSLWP